jgi:hypothetical protein
MKLNEIHRKRTSSIPVKKKSSLNFSSIQIKIPDANKKESDFIRLKDMYKNMYAPSDAYIPYDLSWFFQKAARDLMGTNYELML